MPPCFLYGQASANAIPASGPPRPLGEGMTSGLCRRALRDGNHQPVEVLEVSLKSRAATLMALDCGRSAQMPLEPSPMLRQLKDASPPNEVGEGENEGRSNLPRSSFRTLPSDGANPDARAVTRRALSPLTAPVFPPCGLLARLSPYMQNTHHRHPSRAAGTHLPRHWPQHQ